MKTKTQKQIEKNVRQTISRLEKYGIDAKFIDVEAVSEAIYKAVGEKPDEKSTLDHLIPVNWYGAYKLLAEQGKHLYPYGFIKGNSLKDSEIMTLFNPLNYRWINGKENLKCQQKMVIGSRYGMYVSDYFYPEALQKIEDWFLFCA